MPVCLCYVFACMYVFTSVCVGAQERMCMKKSEDKLGFSRNHLPFSCFWERSLPDLGGACQEGWTGWLWTRTVTCALSRSGFARAGHSAWLFHMASGNQSQIHNWAISSVLVCLSFFFPLGISNPFVYLKLTWWYRKSPDSLSPQWAWKFLYLTPCFTICWKRWNNTKAILLPRPVVYVGMDVLYSMTSSLQYDIIPGYAFNALKLSYVPPVAPIHGIYYLYILQLQFFIHIQNTAFNWVHLWCIIFPVIMSQHV